MQLKLTLSIAILTLATFIFSSCDDESQDKLSFSVSVEVYDEDETDLVTTNAEMTVMPVGGSLETHDLDAGVNTISVEEKADMYVIGISKEGYESYQAEFTSAELAEFTSDDPLTVTLFLESINEGMVAWYTFSGNAQDASGNNNHGLVQGATLTSAKDGSANSAYQFNGTTSIQLPVAPLLLDVYTYSAWVNASSIPQAGGTGNVFSLADNATGKHQSINVSNAYGTAMATGWCVGGWNDGPVQNSGVNSNVLPTTSQWYHIVMVRSSDAVTMYLNNELVGSSLTNGAPPLYGAANTATIGIRTGFSQGFNGKVDNFRIYNRALSAEEVGNLFAKE